MIRSRRAGQSDGVALLVVATWALLGWALWKVERLENQIEKHKEAEEIIHSHMWDQMGVK